MEIKKERTFVAIKPDGIQRSLMGEIISRFERAGLKLVGMKMALATPEMIEKHYTVDPNWRVVTGQKTIEAYKKQGKTPPSEDPMKITEVILGNLKKYMSSGPLIAMVWEGVHSVSIVRKLIGGTEPLTSDVGTIRGDFTIDSYILSDVDGRSVRNLVHASGNTSDSEKEIDLWFKKEELVSYRLIQEAILYDVNLDGILE